MTNQDASEIFNGQIQSTYGTESEKGIGLGLFLCRELNHRLNGTIRLESAPGQGSTFFLVLPSYQAPGADDREAAAVSEGEAYG